MKREILKLLTSERIVPAFRPFQRGAATIFMLHRFADSEYGNSGHSVEALRANLSFLRRHGYRLIGLTDLLTQLEENCWPNEPAVLFTVDDGYGDFARVAAPVFAEFDCPVTVFITTGFVDGGFWMWWDRVRWAFTETTRTSVELQLGPRHHRYSLASNSERAWAAADLIERLKSYPAAVTQAVVDDLLRCADLELPQHLPREFLPMTWDDVTRCATQGVTFGPHTLTHPILSQVDDQRAQAELLGSWQRLRTFTSRSIPVFCFPNGDYASFTDRERQIAAAIGMRACVVAEQNFVTSRFRSSGLTSIVELPRFAYTDDTAQFRQIVGGMERLKQTLRSVSNTLSHRRTSVAGAMAQATPP